MIYYATVLTDDPISHIPRFRFMRARVVADNQGYITRYVDYFNNEHEEKNFKNTIDKAHWLKRCKR